MIGPGRINPSSPIQVYWPILPRVIDLNDATHTPRIRHWGKTYSNSTDKVVWVGLSMKWIVSSKQQEMWLEKRVPYVFTYMGAQDFDLEAWSRYGDSESNSFKEPTLRPTGLG